MKDNLNLDIIVQPFNVNVRIIFADSIEDGINTHNENSLPIINLEPHEYRNIIGVVNSWIAEDDKRYYICILRNDCEIKHITHEAFHLTSTILKHKDIKLNNKTEEIYAYMIEYIFNEIYSFKQLKQLK